jgi:hypothetical protein
VLKAIVSYSKKVPVEGQEFSSQGYSLSLEQELPQTDPAAIQAKLHETYELVRATVEKELASGNGKHAGPADAGSNMVPLPARGNTKASNKQCKYICDLSRDRGLSLSDLNTHVKREYGAETIYDLSKTDASKVVDWLKATQRKAA